MTIRFDLPRVERADDGHPERVFPLGRGHLGPLDPAERPLGCRRAEVVAAERAAGQRVDRGDRGADGIKSHDRVAALADRDTRSHRGGAG